MAGISGLGNVGGAPLPAGTPNQIIEASLGDLVDVASSKEGEIQGKLNTKDPTEMYNEYTLLQGAGGGLRNLLEPAITAFESDTTLSQSKTLALFLDL